MSFLRGTLVALILGSFAVIPSTPRAEEVPPQQRQAQDRARAAAQQQQAARAAQRQAQQQAARAAQQQAARAGAQQQQAARAAQQQAARAAAQQHRQAQEQTRAAARAAQQQRQAQEHAARAAQQQRQAQERAAQQQRRAQEQAARAAQQQQRQVQEQARAAKERGRAGQERARVQQQQLQAQERARVEQQHREAEQQRARTAAEQQRANEHKQVLEKQRFEREAAGRRRAEEQRQAAQQGRAPEGFGQTPQPGARQPVVVRHEQLRQEKARLSGDQRLRLRQAFPVNRDRVARAQFTRRIGTRIPRTVRLFAVPAAVLAIFPYYRDYRYVVEDNTICIVDSDTYEVVDVLDEEPYTPGLRPQVAELTLSASEAEFVLGSIPPNFPQARLRLRLALGVEIPASVELYEFAPVVLDRIPKLTDFRFVVSEDQLVIVTPHDRSVALVLDL